MTKLRKFVSKDILKPLYFAFPQSHIDYGLILWDTTMNSTTNKIVQNFEKAVRKIFFKVTMPSQKHCLKNWIHWFFIKKKAFSILQFKWKLHNNDIPESISGLFQLIEKIYLTNNLKYLVPNVSLDNTKNSLLFQGPVFWNKLPAVLKMSKTISLFKTMLKSYLLDINLQVTKKTFWNPVFFYLLQFSFQN